MCCDTMCLMKKFLFLGLILLFSSPFFALAQQPYARYCPDPTHIFTGVATNRDGSPKIELVVDPIFNEKMKRERFTDYLPVAPIYDLVFSVVPSINEYCLPQYDENGTRIKKMDPPKTLPFTASIELSGKALISASSLAWNGRRNENEQPLYEWKIKGWENGIVSESKMEKLIRAIHDNNPPPTLAVQMKFSDGRRERIDQSTNFTLCAPVWGSGAHEVVYDRVAHRLSDFIYQSESIISGAFLKVDPFREYQKWFTHLINLRNYYGESWFNIHLATRKGEQHIAEDCGGKQSNHIAISPLVPLGDFASALSSGRFIQIASDVTKRILDYNAMGTSLKFFVPVPFPLIALHEFGHVFSGLNDEYLSGQVSGKNCSINPAFDWSYNGVQYGDTSFEGCGYPTVHHRPSEKSIMRGAQSGETRFNVVSCGYIIAAIKKEGEGPKYWKECMNPEWNTIKPIGKVASFGLPNLASIFQSLIRVPSSASVRDAVGSGEEIHIEHFSADGTITGEVISVPSISYSPLPLADVDLSEDTSELNSQTVPPTSNLGDLANESIFDTVSVNLKVNGQDGPVEVEKRSRIVLSWISEGATRCRGVWSKNDIKLSGTAAGRITRDATIKVACINADGERADDAVVVNVVE